MHGPRATETDGSSVIDTGNLADVSRLNPQPVWYAIQTRARHEKRIGAEIARKGITAFVPTRCENHRWSDRMKIVEVPVFSCYVFVQLRAIDEHRLHVLNVPGVFRFVSVNGSPAPIPDPQIESLQKVLESKLPLTAYGFLNIGERVRIRGGSLDGVEGTLVGVKGEHKLVVCIDLIQQAVAVTIDGYAVERT